MKFFCCSRPTPTTIISASILHEPSSSLRWEDGCSRDAVPQLQRTHNALAALVQEEAATETKKEAERHTVLGKREREADLERLLGSGKGSIMGPRKTGLTNFQLDKLLDSYGVAAADRGNKQARQDRAKSLVENELNSLRAELSVYSAPTVVPAVSTGAEGEAASLISASGGGALPAASLVAGVLGPATNSAPAASESFLPVAAAEVTSPGLLAAAVRQDRPSLPGSFSTAAAAAASPPLLPASAAAQHAQHARQPAPTAPLRRRPPPLPRPPTTSTTSHKRQTRTEMLLRRCVTQCPSQRPSEEGTGRGCPPSVPRIAPVALS